MTPECTEVRERIAEIDEPTGTPEPYGDLERLRAHASSCVVCQQELEGIRALRKLGREALGASPSLLELGDLEAVLATGRRAFLDFVASATPPERPETPTRPRVESLDAAIRQALTTPRGWLPLFRPVQIPRYQALQAAGPIDELEAGRPILVQHRDEANVLLVELLLQPGEQQLFLSTHVAELAEATVELTLTVESAPPMQATLKLEGGQAAWTIPQHLRPEGACGIAMVIRQ